MSLKSGGLEKFLKIGLLTGSLFLTDCTITETPEIIQPKIVNPSTLNRKNMNLLMKSVYKIKVETIIKETFSDLKDNHLGSIDSPKKNYGTCFAFGRDHGNDVIYFATAEHCLPDIDLNEEITYIGGLVKGRKKISKVNIYLVSERGEEIIIDELKEKARDKSSDVAILQGREARSFSYYPIFIGQKNIFPGQEVYSVGFPHNKKNWERQVTKGIISNVKPDSKISGGNNIIMTEAVLDYGMSGGPSFVIHDGMPMILGVNSRVYTDLKSKYGISSGLIDLIEREKLEYAIDVHNPDGGK